MGCSVRHSILLATAMAATLTTAWADASVAEAVAATKEGVSTRQVPRMPSAETIKRAVENAKQLSAKAKEAANTRPAPRPDQSAPPESPFERATRENAERSREAFQRANTMAKPRVDVPTASAPKLPEFAYKVTGKPIDPAEVAQRYLESRLKDAPEDAPTLRVFVSLSMPKDSLHRIAADAARAGGILVFRGIKGGLGKGQMEAMVTELQPYVQHGAEFQIDPEAFKRYDVSTVPTYVVTTETPGCAAEVCAFKSTSRAGDVSLDYALQHMLKSEKDSELATIERRHLTAMGRKDLP